MNLKFPCQGCLVEPCCTKYCDDIIKFISELITSLWKSDDKEAIEYGKLYAQEEIIEKLINGKHIIMSYVHPSGNYFVNFNEFGEIVK